ncbi:uncharacterized protein LOC118289171 isoform X2 [Scophthalmus maximus]|uniref:uncharacterized protein LOC118289171 isoform X2 n=1 Tax=Scophthalmus maximus TaxID=52904 RepID=UPI001FA81F9E|nr:uncharacterized protein LOC118289171 isoform X2 [Scophthalmus maximus]
MPTNTKKKKQRLRKPAKDKRTKKNQVSMEKSCEAFRSNRSEFEGFLDQMTQWFSDHQQQVDQHFSLEDKDQSGSVNLKDFELGLTTLSAPCQQLQLRLLTELLKTNDNNTISYQDLKRQLQRLSTEVDVSSSKRRDDQLLNPDKDRFVRLSVRLIPFDLCDDHPANFQVVLSSSCRVVRLIGMIRERVGIQTSRLEVFRSRAPTDDEARLPPERSLEECGFGGGPEKTPPEETLYYDYRLELTDCPVLNCDHYFRSTPDSLPGRLDPVDE